MKTIFETQKIDKKFYDRFIGKYIMSQIPWADRLKFWVAKKSLQIIIRPSSMASSDPFFHGVNGVGGNTAPTKMVLYVEDVWENPLDHIQRVFRRNGKMISHELLHWLLMVENRGERVSLRNDDYSGHKAGTMLNFWTAEVHDRDTERNLMTLKFPYYMRKAHGKVWYTISVLNGKDLF